ncbi:hypothetical protein DSO57_1032966 [Entomophthora muscae]|uniref:Uncharacterized protein n=1 Tax=Entomophthora muscae TaxID=34485 RepID=A0ACC2UM83_9FUNG|nr:hypothetical protein DSO57_1032966 [Entomophthora muscae]
MEFMLQEVAGELSVNRELPSNLKWPLKVSSLVLNPDAKSRNNDFSQIKAEEIRIFGFQAEELIIAEPSVLEWYYGSIKTITGITGTRLKRVVLGRDVRNRIQFSNVTRLDSLVFNQRLYPTFPSLMHVDDARARYLMGDLIMDIQSVGKLDIITGDYSGGQSILLNNLETAEEVTIASHKVKLFSAPKLMYGRLEIKHATELNLNMNLRWNGTSFITSDDFCEKYFKAFKDHGLAFKTDNRCNVDCKQPYTPMNLTSYLSCREFKTIEINNKSDENITLYKATTITGDLIITNYNGTFSAPKLTEITGNVILTNPLNFSFSAPNLKKIQGSVTIQGSGSFSIPTLEKIKGDITIKNSSFFSALNLDEIKGDVTILDSSFFLAPKLKKIQGSVTIHDTSDLYADNINESQRNMIIQNSGSFSSPNLNSIQGSVTIQNSSSFLAPTLEKIQGNITILDFSELLTPKLKEIQGSITINDTSSLIAENLNDFQGIIILQNSSYFSASTLGKLQGDVTILDSSYFTAPKLKEIKGIVTIQDISTFLAPSLSKFQGSIILQNSSFFLGQEDDQSIDFSTDDS